MSISPLQNPLLLIAAILSLGIGTPAHAINAAPATNPQVGYGNFTQYYTLPYANSPVFGSANPDDPTIKLIVDNTTFTVPLDTGSRALYVSSDQLPSNITLTGPTGFVYLNSSARIFQGSWTNTTVTFPDAVGAGGATGPATATMLVLVVQSVTASINPPPGSTTPGATFGTRPESGNVILEDGSMLAFSNHTLTLTPGQVANYTANAGILNSSENFGVGFDRTGPGTSPNTDQYNQQYDAFLNISQMRAGTMIAGYILTPDSVQLGLTNTTTGFAYTNLVPTGLSQVPGSPPDWQAPMGTVVYDNVTYPAGQLVLDIGIPHGIITLPGQPQTGSNVTLPFTVNLINSAGAVSYQINDNPDNILSPVADSESPAIAWFAPLPGNFSENQPPYQGQLFNTGRNVLNAFNLVYDATNGFLGVKPNGVSVPSASISFTPGFYPNPITPTPPFITAGPLDQGVVVGANVTFTVTARGTPNPAYQWQISTNNGRTWKNITSSSGFRSHGATTASLEVKTNWLMNNDLFRVKVSSTLGTKTSSPAVLIFGNYPSIVIQPLARTVKSGQNAVFRVLATGQAPLQYAWYFNNKLLKNSGKVRGATSNLLILSKVTAANVGDYYVFVSNALGSATSKSVALTVQ
jgi:hypothetical protein